MRWNPSCSMYVASIPPALVLGCLGAETAASHPVGWFLTTVAVTYMAAVPFARSLLDGPGIRNARTTGSFWLVVTGSLGVLMTGPAEHLVLEDVMPAWGWLESAGPVLAAAGAALAAWAQAVRRGLSGVQAHSGQIIGWLRLGPYRAVRHPGYSALLLAALGVALGYGSGIAVAVILGLLLPGLVLRIGCEERQMLRLLGANSCEAAGPAQRLVPGLW
jgi:protein-S-isoprenylcysteine O-methyltransferase Ste14